MADRKNNISRNLSINDKNEDDRSIGSHADDNTQGSLSCGWDNQLTTGSPSSGLDNQLTTRSPSSDLDNQLTTGSPSSDLDNQLTTGSPSSDLDNQLTTGSSVNVVDTKGCTQLGQNSTIVNGNQIYNITNHNHYHYPFPPAHRHGNSSPHPYDCQPCLRYHNNDHQPLTEQDIPRSYHPVPQILPSPQKTEQTRNVYSTRDKHSDNYSLSDVQALNEISTMDLLDLDFILNYSIDQSSSPCETSIINSPYSPVATEMEFPNSDGENSYLSSSFDETLSTTSLESSDYQPFRPSYEDVFGDSSKDLDEEEEVEKFRGRTGRDGKSKRLLLWKFLLEVLDDRPDVAMWEDRQDGTFRVVNTKALSRMWGEKKRIKNMTFAKLSKGMKSYYKSGLLSKVKGTPLVYKFNWQHVPKPFRKN